MKYPIKRNYEPLRMIALAQSELKWKFITTFHINHRSLLIGTIFIKASPEHSC
jgi:hypothetical protein